VVVEQLTLKNFRCFKHYTLDFLAPISCIIGDNGSGKSSILEALHYACYLRSFRTHMPRELVSFDHENFFIKAVLQETINAVPFVHELTLGFSKRKRIVKIDQQAVMSYKEILKLYRVVTLTQDDLSLIKGSPEGRRLFLDQALSLEFPEFYNHCKRYRHILENRNALLNQGGGTLDSYNLWTQQLWQETLIIQGYRKQFLKRLESLINAMLVSTFSEGLSVIFAYQAKKTYEDQTFDAFMALNNDLYHNEIFLKRSLFGAHLDDFFIDFCQKNSRAFASRGQQKLIIMLIKIAQMQEIAAKYGKVLFLLDDFMTDFDSHKGEQLLSLMLPLPCQLIFTSPSKSSYFDLLMGGYGAQEVMLT
jgi:DNA replication and repair protein RecF